MVTGVVSETAKNVELPLTRTSQIALTVTIYDQKHPSIAKDVCYLPPTCVCYNTK